LLIWARFASTLIAPLWHYLYPAGQFHCKPGSFPSVQYHLLLLHLSYPNIKPELKAVAALNNGSSMTQLLNDFEFLFEFAIPTVAHECILCTQGSLFMTTYGLRVRARFWTMELC
jgi:hypothetical protein